MKTNQQTKSSHVILYGFMFILSICTWSCDEPTKGKNGDTPTSGNIHVFVDESFKPLLDTEVSTFESLYPKAKITTHYTSETDAIKALLNDSARLAVTSRDFTQEEISFFKKIPITPHSIKIATDGLAIILNKENTDTAFSYEQLKNIFSGKISSWKQLNPKSSLADIQIIFDNNHSGTSNYIQTKIIDNAPLPAHCYAGKGNAWVIDYVSQNPNSMGIIGVNWISDLDDPSVQQFVGKIRVAAVAGKDITNPSSGDYYKPYQAYIATGAYPLTRQVYVLSREARSGLGSGFMSFMAGDKGQRIILKSALVPATMPVRIVGFKN